MKNNKALTRTFAKFAKMDVNVVETDKVYTPRNGGEPIPYKDYKLDASDTAVSEMKKFANEKGFPRVRVWLPNTMGTMDARADRLNVDIRKNDDGKWRMGNFRIG